MPSLYVITAWLTTFTASIVGILVYGKNPKRAVNKRWTVMSLSIAIWSLFLGFMFSSKDAKSGFMYSRILMIGANLIPITFYHFVLALLELHKEKRQRIIISLGYLVAILLLLLNFTPLFVKSASYKSIVRCFYPDAGPFYIGYILIYFGFSGYAYFLMHKAISKLTGFKRNQIIYVMFASAVGFLGGATTFPLWYQIKIPPLGSHFVWIYSLAITIAILRHQLMDIKVALSRAGMFVIVYTLVLGIPFWIGFKYLGKGLWILPVSITVVFATAGPFIYLFLQRRTENILLKEQKRYQKTLKQASIGMTRIRNLRKLLDLITHIVTKTVKISYAAIYLHNEETNEYILQVSRDKGKIGIPKLTSDNPLIQWLILKREPLIYEEVKVKTQDSNGVTYKLLEENMRLLTASVIIPSFLENRFMGFFVLGEKISGQIYTPDDLNVFEVLASQAALAIENAKFYDETKKMQEQIAQAEKMATVGTMADGLSHQINNRFYALSLIAADTIEAIKEADTSKCTPELKEMISQINYALERIRTNVIQGGEVVKGILKYTRKGEEGFEALSLDQILDGALGMVQYKVNLAEFDIVRNYPKHNLKIKGNLVQLQEAFFNFIDNAYDAMTERKASLKEEGYRGKITVSATAKNGTLEIVVEDNGLGIKEGNQSKLFTPFFTTKVSSRQSTGLGLYVIRRIIEEINHGKISFKSEYGKGTRFIVELPIA